MSFKIIKKLNGNSNSEVYLINKDNQLQVLKTKMIVDKTYQQLLCSLPFNTPKIYHIDDNSIYMEYLNGISMIDYVKNSTKLDLDKLYAFLKSYIDWTLNSSELFDFNDIVEEKLNFLSNYCCIDNFRYFNKILPRSIIHGDLTLENILYYNDKFYFIDLNQTKLNSIVFDVNKIMQDLKNYWFIRNSKDKHRYKKNLEYINQKLSFEYYYLLDKKIESFMLARILPYIKTNKDKLFILNAINKTCK